MEILKTIFGITLIGFIQMFSNRVSIRNLCCNFRIWKHYVFFNACFKKYYYKYIKGNNRTMAVEYFGS